MLQLRSAQMPLIPIASAAMTTAKSTPATSTAAPAAIARVTKGRVLTSKLALDTFTVRRVADRRENGADALDQEHALGQLAVVENGLNDIVAVRVTQQLLETRAVEDFGDEHLANLGIGDADALFDDVG